MTHQTSLQNGLQVCCLMLATLPLLAGDLHAQSGSESNEFQAYPLRHAAAADVETALLRMLPKGSQVVADARGNQLLVRGTPQVHQMAVQLIQTLDRPATPRAAPQRQPEPQPVTFHPYPVPANELEVRFETLRTELANVPGARVAADRRTSQLLILAPEVVHQEIRRWLADANPRQAEPAPSQTATPRTTEPRAEPAPRRRAATELPQSGHAVRLRFTSSQQIEQSLVRYGARPLSAGQDQDIVTYSMPIAGGKSVPIYVDRRLNQVVVHGLDRAADATLRLVEALDSADDGANTTQIVPLGNAKYAQVQKAVNAVRLSGIATHATEAALGQAALRGNGPLAARLFQQQQSGANQQPDGNQPPAQPNQPPNGEQPGVEAGQPSPGRPVQIEYIEGLDMFIIRGPKEDVERVKQLIRDIENYTKFTEPLIEVYPLKNVDSQAMSEMVTQLYDQALAARLGRVTITPLIKPNALLLVGREDSVRSVIELINRLDQPVGPATQFETFRLRYASAAAVKQTIDEFFSTSTSTPPNQQGRRPGLGTRVIVTADVRSNSLIVQASPRDMAEVALLIQKIDVGDSDKVNELRVFHLEHTLAEELAPILQGAINAQADTRGGAGLAGITQQPGQAAAGGITTTSQGQVPSTMLRFLAIDSEGQKKIKSGILTDVRITANPRSNTLVVSAPAESMELIAALIRQLDAAPAAISQIKVFTIVNGDAVSLVDMLESLFGAAQQAGGFGPGQIGPQAASATQGESTLIPLRFSVDQRTNSIIASGSEPDLNVVEAILLRLDESDVRQRQSQVYRLKNSPAADVSNAINEFLRSERDVQQLATEGVSPFEQIEREVVVVPEPVSNSLIVSATPRYFQEIAKLVEQLDARPPMVLIQVLIGEVQLRNTDEFGVELGIQDSVLFDRSIIGDIVTISQTTTSPNGVQTTNQNIVSQTATPGFNFNNQPLGANPAINQQNFGGQALTNFAVGRVNGELGFGGLVLSGGNESLSVLVRMLHECGRLEVLSRPQVMTLDNQPAFIQVGQRVPRITGTATNQTGQTNTVTLENVGLILGVTPRISPDGLVVMEIDAEKSRVGPLSEGIPVSISATGEVITSPRIDTTTAQTTVSAASGQTIVLGGLITKEKTEFRRRVPVLSNIPVLGNLFRYDGVQTKRTELLIIMTPHVVRNEEDAERLKQIEAARMSWCLSDVIQMGGPETLRGRYDEWPDEETTVVYPDANPAATRTARTSASPLPTAGEGPQLQPVSPNQPPKPDDLPSLPRVPPPPAEQLPQDVQPASYNPRTFRPENSQRMPAGRQGSTDPDARRAYWEYESTARDPQFRLPPGGVAPAAYSDK